ncbi:hypothetical protein [Actinoplanes sp. NPDC049265]|uniref:hypothetical protein n=1 Tax=Actinoplanes sp. NPDC049265 TaxID=3363902 RepID=UPI00371F9A7D
MTELLKLHGIVEAPPDAVAAVLLDVRPGGRSPLATTGRTAPAESPQAPPAESNEARSAERHKAPPAGSDKAPPAATGQAGPAESDEFTVTRDGSVLTVTVDRARRSVTLQGEWWYRGVTSVEPDPRGSRIVHRVFDVATGRHWAVRFVSRGPLNAAPRAFADQLAALGRELGVNAWVEED